jgi:hypothetical protein
MLTLVTLAAGLGRRFGGDKQLAPMGPSGQPLLWYALHDAAAAGFSDAVLVVREGLEAPLRAQLHDTPLPLRFVIQAQRTPVPWGTGHALLAAAPAVTRPFMVINADDYYGPGAYRIIAAFLSGPRTGPVPEFALAAFPLSATLSPHGPVNRAVCQVDGAGCLSGLKEHHGLVWERLILPPDTPVSMNCWGFTPALFPLLRGRFEQFRAASEGEFMLPEAVGQLAASGAIQVRVLSAPGRWFGLTHPADREPLAGYLARLPEATEFQVEEPPPA